MTDKQKQNILQFLGLYDGAIDGIWGPKSQAAMESVRKKYPGQDDTAALLEAVADWEPVIPETESTGTFWDEIEYFSREEFRCQCGGKYCNGFHVEPHETMVRLCNEIRRRASVPILIRDAGGSGLRCPQWNATIPGAAQLYDIAEAVMAEMIPGRGGLGLYSWGIHVDIGKYSRWNG